MPRVTYFVSVLFLYLVARNLIELKRCQELQGTLTEPTLTIIRTVLLLRLYGRCHVTHGLGSDLNHVSEPVREERDVRIGSSLVEFRIFYHCEPHGERVLPTHRTHDTSILYRYTYTRLLTFTTVL